MVPYHYMTRAQTKHAFVACLLLVGSISIPTTSTSLAVPFGGKIVQFFPACVAPVGAAMRLSLPTPYPLMYLPGSRSYSYGPPVRTGQWLLGMSGPYVPCLVPCGRRGVCAYAPLPGGLVIDFHGSSLPIGPSGYPSVDAFINSL